MHDIGLYHMMQYIKYEKYKILYNIFSLYTLLMQM